MVNIVILCGIVIGLDEVKKMPFNGAYSGYLLRIRVHRVMGKTIEKRVTYLDEVAVWIVGDILINNVKQLIEVGDFVKIIGYVKTIRFRMPSGYIYTNSYIITKQVTLLDKVRVEEVDIGEEELKDTRFPIEAMRKYDDEYFSRIKRKLGDKGKGKEVSSNEFNGSIEEGISGSIEGVDVQSDAFYQADN